MNLRQGFKTTWAHFSSKGLAVAFSLIITFGLGYLAASLNRTSDSTFHDIMVSDPDDLPELITPGDSRVCGLAVKLQTPENAYAYVRDTITFDPSLPALPARDIIESGKASCLGKAILLCSLYRAMGIPASDVRVVTGELSHPSAIIDHAWVDLEYQGVCLQQDATNLIGIFRFDEFQSSMYTRSFVRKEGYAFNDRDFALISSLNLIKGTHPAVH